MAQTKIKAGLFEGIIGNGTDGYFLMSNGDGTMTWSSIIVNPTIASIAYPGSVTAADPAGGETITVTGTGFKTGATVTIGGTAAPAVSYVSATQITFTTPAKAAGDYDIVVTNTDTGSATYINGISYNGIPTWTTAAGSLGTFASDTTISTITLQATEPDAGTITFSITNGALPTGLSLTGANIDGTTTLETADTLYTFTVTATDDESQATPRTFTITVTKQLIGTENFTINTYTGNGSTQSIEGKIDTAADFNGSASSYVTADNFFLSGQSGTSVSFSVSCWFYARTFNHATYPTLFKTIDAGYTNQAPPFVWTDGSVIRFHGYTYADASVSLSTNTWYHLVFTQDNGTLKGYLDGSELTLGAATAWDPTILPIFMFGGAASSTTGWNGKIDQLRVFDRALSSSEVTTLYGENNTSSTKSTTDIFNDGSGVALYEFEKGAIDTGGVSGYIGAGGIFNGSSSRIDALNVSNFPTGNNSRSISLWVYNQSTVTAGIIGYGNSATGEAFYLYLDAQGELGVYGYLYNYDSNYTLPTNQWVHLVITHDGTTTRVYANGNEQFNLARTFNTGTNSFRIGGVQWNNSGEFFNGKIDQVRIFNKALSSSEITTLYGETSASATKSTTDIFDDGSAVALYEFERNANDTGNTYNGTATNVSYAYDGTPTNVSFVGTSFQPDLVWIKRRSNTEDHAWFDSVRGIQKQISSNLTAAEYTTTNAVSSFDSNGFTTGNNGATNTSGQTYVSWCWKAGGAAVSNTDGSITSSVSANPDAGFSIVSYTGSATANQTVGHGLSQTPELIIVKNRDTAGNSWAVQSSAMGGADWHMLLNSTQARQNNVDWIWNDTEPTSTVFTVGQYGLTNQSPDRFIAYCFHSVDSYQKVGSYTGTGSTLPNTITGLGFQPRFLLLKNSTGAYEWVVKDSLRGAANELYPNDSTAENGKGDVSNITFNSDGFSVTTADGATNQNNATIIYLAIA